MKRILLQMTILMIIRLANAQETIVIDADSTNGPFINVTGFLHGQTMMHQQAASQQMMLDLKPHFWRNANWNNTQLFADSLGITTSLVMSDFYSDYSGGYANAHPWENWTDYESFIDTVADLFIAAGAQPQWWDIWNEPDLGMFWQGSIDQLIECYIRSATILRNVDSGIGLVGPSISSYQPYGIEFFLDTLAQNGITLNAVSWHEFGLPDSMAAHVADFRNRMNNNPQWGHPQIHINEFSPPQTGQIPASRLLWMYRLEEANVDWATYACWDTHDDGINNWSGCQTGLDGLIHYDELSPLPVYWVQHAYASLISGLRVFCISSDAQTQAISARNDSLQSFQILTGRCYSDVYGTSFPGYAAKDSADVQITINHYPWLSDGYVPLRIQRIAKGSPVFLNTPLNGPDTIFEGQVQVSGGIIQIQIPDYRDGDVYHIELNPQPSMGESEISDSKAMLVHPNPAQNCIRLMLNPQDVPAKITIKSITGQVVFEQTSASTENNISLHGLPQGTYIINASGQHCVFIKQ